MNNSGNVSHIKLFMILIYHRKSGPSTFCDLDTFAIPFFSGRKQKTIKVLWAIASPCNIDGEFR